MSARAGTLLTLFVVGVPFFALGALFGRWQERRERRRKIARAHRPRVPAREVIREARAVAAGGAPHHPGLALVGKPAFGERPAGDAWDCFTEEDR